MVQFGCCLSAASFVPQMEAADRRPENVLAQLQEGIILLKDIGYDFVELTVGAAAGLSEKDFNSFVDFLQQNSLSVPVFNSFIPPSLPLIGSKVSEAAVREYLDLAMDRAARSGGKMIIFGSGAARHIPDGFPRDAAGEQLVTFLRLCQEYGQKHNLLVAIEPLNRKETNIINTVEEAAQLAASVGLSRIKVLADSYHMDMEGEAPELLKKAAPWLCHVHIADRDRDFPGVRTKDAIDFRSFFSALKEAGYQGGISAECSSKQLRKQSGESLAYVKEICAAAGLI